MLKEIYINSTALDSGESLTPPAVQRALEQAAQRRGLTHELHPTYEMETRMLLHVKNGEPEKLAAVYAAKPTDTAAIGDFSDNAAQQGRSLFITAVTLYTRFAIEGGLDEELAYELSDCYIKYVNSLEDPAKITRLALTCGLDYAKRVKAAKVKRSLPVKRACEYVEQHLYEPVTVAQLAAHCGRTPEYLATAFARQLHCTPKSYILRRKLESARVTLLSTDTSVSVVAQQYGFCNHSNFSMHFKRAYGAAPAAYRAGEHSAAWESMG